MLSWLLPASGWHSWLAEGTKKERELWKWMEVMKGKDSRGCIQVHLSSLYWAINFSFKKTMYIVKII